MLGADVSLVEALCPGKQLIHLSFGGFSVFLLRLHPGLRFFHCRLGGFQFCPVLQEHLIDDTQIQLAFSGQCLDGFLLQGGDLLLSIFKILLRLLVGHLVGFLIPGAGKLHKSLLGNRLQLGKEQPDLIFNRLIQRSRLVAALPITRSRCGDFPVAAIGFIVVDASAAVSQFSFLMMMVVAEPASAVSAVDNARQQAPGVRPEDHRLAVVVLGRSAFDRLLAPHEQVFVDDLQMVKRLRLHSLHVVNADVDRVVDDRPDACPAPETCSAFGLDPFFIQVLRDPVCAVPVIGQQVEDLFDDGCFILVNDQIPHR